MLTKTIEVLWVPFVRSCSAKEETRDYKFKISAAPPLHREVSKTCKQNGMMADTDNDTAEYHNHSKAEYDNDLKGNIHKGIVCIPWVVTINEIWSVVYLGVCLR